MPLTFEQLAAINLKRCGRWHPGGIAGWSVSDWAMAMAGEAGEVCNAGKKLRRVQDECANINDPGRQLSSEKEAIAKIGEELADTLIYLDLLAQRLGLSLGDEVVKKFNATSTRYGFPERLELGRSAPLAYLASPHTLYPAGIDAAWRDVCAITARLIAAGTCVYSPIACTHLMQGHGAPPHTDHAFWLQFDEAMMRVCDVLIVAHMDSWEISKGIAMEVAYFEKAGRPIFDLDPGTLVMTRRVLA